MSYETEATGYGLDFVGAFVSIKPQSNFILSENIEPLPSSNEVVFIDSTVKDIQTLTDNISGAAEVIVLDSDRDELVQISEQLSNYEDLDAVHIVSHGELGQLSFGNATLNSDTLPEYKEVLEEWSLALDAEADLLLYGCDVTLDGQGNSFVRELSQISHADISASIDDTGINGNWKLETAVGEVEATSIFTEEINDAYQHNLADVEGSFSENVSGGGSSTISNSDGTLEAFDNQVNDELRGGGDDDDDDGSDLSFEGDQFFDADFYLEQNPDVAEAGVDPLEHYDESGWKEGRDPNKIFDTSFYLDQNPDVTDAGINPLQHYYENAATDEIIRYPNQTFRSLGTSDQAIIVASSDLSSVEFGAVESFAEITEIENPEVAVAIPLVYYTIAGGIAITAIGIELIRSASTIQELVEGSTTYTRTPDDGGIDTSIPPFDTGETVTIERETFPNGNRFIENILEGQFEFPDNNEVSFTDNFQSINSGDSIFDDDSLWDDSDVINNPSIPDVSPEAETIANGHGFPKHKDEFPDVQTREDYAKEIDTIINGASGSNVKTGLPNGRSAYWDDATGTVVVVDPADPDGGTAFKPKIAKKYFDDL